MTQVSRREFGKTVAAAGRHGAQRSVGRGMVTPPHQPRPLQLRHRNRSQKHIGDAHYQRRVEDESYLEWDRAGERFTSNAEANRHLSYKYRAPFKPIRT